MLPPNLFMTNELDILKQEVATLKAQVEHLTYLIAPPPDKAEIRRLVAMLGPDGAAKVINRRAGIQKS